MSETDAGPPRPEAPSWTFLSNHGHVLLCLARWPDARMREVAERVGITERSVQTIVRELEAGGVITRTREGRRNRYRIHSDTRLRHDVERHCSVGELIEMVWRNSERPTSDRRESAPRP